jgi:TetR/AcrR family transcriptional regulator, transcriptional repressor for nem operon
MRYPKDHKQKTRERLLDDTARHVKKHGFAGSGVDAIAASAGVTSGALYKHFAGKSGLFAAVVAADLQRTADRFAAVAPGDGAAARMALAAYLSLAHVRQADRGCPLPALTPEIARADDTVREAFQAGLVDVHAQVEKLTGSSTRAWALIAQCVGAVMLARAMPGARERAELLDAVTQEASALLAHPGRPADGDTPGARTRTRRQRTEQRQ